MSKGEVYLAEAYNKLRGGGAALALAGLFMLLGFIVLAAGAAAYKVYVDPATGAVVENATRADVEAGRVVEELRINGTLFRASLAAPITEVGSMVIREKANNSLYYFGYSQLLLFLAALAGLAASGVLRGVAAIFQDYSGAFRAARLGGLLKIAAMVVLLFALWQIRGAIIEESEALLLGALGVYYVGGILAVVGSVLFSVPLILEADKVAAHKSLVAAAALHMLGAIVTFFTVNTVQLIVGPALCLAAGAIYAVGSQKTLNTLG